MFLDCTMKQILAAVVLFTCFVSQASAVDECERAEELRFIQIGDSVSHLLSLVGAPDHKEGKEFSESDTYTYFATCGNQTIFIFKIKDGKVISIEREIDR